MISLKLFLSSKNVSSKCIIVSLEQYLPWNTKKTKIVKIHVNSANTENNGESLDK